MTTHDLVALLQGKRIAILTGAGCSTESGIPDYRGPQARPRKPIQHRDFVESEATRRRYWARSAVGWPRMAGARPNAAHRAIAELEARGLASGLITQNVDRLHHKAGSREVLELHGALADVRCLDCGALESRDALQTRIAALNPDLGAANVTIAPDGDADLPLELVENFRVPACLACGGVLKPDVVFFGGSVPRERVMAAFAKLDAADVLLVVGSSLAVFSGYRFVLRAAEMKMPIAIVNRGETRGDPHAALRVDGAAGEVLPALARALC
ncbi:MAG TPA: NAD-dependent protein deacetylase [Polyangiaceae bacterium]|jgi:NAD-dependent SIR2 family protein deacetylase